MCLLLLDTFSELGSFGTTDIISCCTSGLGTVIEKHWYSKFVPLCNETLDNANLRRGKAPHYLSNAINGLSCSVSSQPIGRSHRVSLSLHSWSRPRLPSYAACHQSPHSKCQPSNSCWKTHTQVLRKTLVIWWPSQCISMCATSLLYKKQRKKKVLFQHLTSCVRKSVNLKPWWRKPTYDVKPCGHVWAQPLQGSPFDPFLPSKEDWKRSTEGRLFSCVWIGFLRAG